MQSVNIKTPETFVNIKKFTAMPIDGGYHGESTH